jgi:DnaJ-domain-containing protein 1
MAWWAKVIGGSAGYFIGGPVGGIIGLALGAVADGAVDDDPTKGIPELDIENRFVEDDFGRFVQLFFKKDVPNGAVVVALLHDSRGRPIRAIDAFAEKGNFVSHRAIERGKSEFYVPYSALQYRRPGIYTLMVTVLFMSPGAEQPTTLGQKTFDFELPSPKSWSRLEFLEPLMGLCVSVLRADGLPSQRGEKIVLTFFKENFDIPRRHRSKLRLLLTDGPKGDLHAFSQAVTRRMPALKAQDILELLTEIARCDGPPSREAKRRIKDIAIYLGIPENRWAEMERKLDLQSKIADPWEMLGIDRSATMADIKKAYKVKLSGLHPDKVARMDPEIQELAKTRTVELREAYETVLEQADGL